MKLDQRAFYDPTTESIRTGDGKHVSLRDLQRALTGLNPITLKRVLKRSGLDQVAGDPMEHGRAEAVQEVLALCRGLPQYTVPLILAAAEIPKLESTFAPLIRDRLFGSSTAKVAGEWKRPADPDFSSKIGHFFWESREIDGEFCFFVRSDRKTVVLRAGQRFSSTKPYAESFLVMRTAMGRYFLRWPDQHRHVPAFYLDSNDQAVHFFPRQEGAEILDFEEIYPGWTYEVFGVQFSLPNLGTDYRAWDDEAFPDELIDEERSSEVTEKRLNELLAIVEAVEGEIRTLRDLSRHFRAVSLRYHPLKHLHASEEEKKRINERYLAITNAYNELKRLVPKDE